MTVFQILTSYNYLIMTFYLKFLTLKIMIRHFSIYVRFNRFSHFDFLDTLDSSYGIRIRLLSPLLYIFRYFELVLFHNLIIVLLL